jgi:MarR family transcriptional regulator, organic hydroperoxide resistance regulator
MAMADLRRLLGDLGRVHAQLDAAVSLRLRSEFGLPLVLLEMMTVLAETENCRVHDLAARLGVSNGAASKLVDRLEAARYCRRLPNPEDRRSCLLVLTSTGRQTFEHASQAVDEELERLFGTCLSATQITELAATLRELLAAVQRHGPPRKSH